MNAGASPAAAIATMPAAGRAAAGARNRCAQCHLPISGRGLTLPVGGVPQSFCCHGCHLVLRITGERGSSGQEQGIVLRLGLALFFAMNAMMFGLAGYFPYLYGTTAPDSGFLLLLRLMTMALSIPVLALLGIPVLWQAVRDAGQFLVRTDGLIAVGALAAFGLSVRNTLAGGEHVYFDTVAMLLILVTLGRYLEAHAKSKTGALLQALSRTSQTPLQVRRDGVSIRLPAEELRVGDLIDLDPGEASPVDGVLVHGEAYFTESSVTGDATPIRKEPGACVTGGSVNLDGRIRLRVTAVGATSTLGRIAAIVEETLAERGGLQRLADRIAAVFVPLVVLGAAGVFVYWWNEAGSEAAMLYSLSVLVVACPCAFGIATPAAIWIGVAEAARRGILFDSPASIETLAHVRRVWFDYTGTLTSGRLELIDIVTSPARKESTEQLLAVARSLEAGIPHPIARALEKQAGSLVTASATDVRYESGLGVTGTIGARRWYLGSRAFFAGLGVQMDESVRDPSPIGAAGLEAFLGTAASDGSEMEVCATLRFADGIRPETEAVLSRLRACGIEVGVLTGGSDRGLRRDASLCELERHSGLRPEEKVDQIRQAARSGPVAMVGDGVNDAPALAAADVGIALGTGADLTRSAASVNVVSDDLTAVPWLILWSRRVYRAIVENLFWALSYNGLAIAAAAFGWLNPLLAAVVMIASSLFVIANARRLSGQIPAVTP